MSGYGNKYKIWKTNHRFIDSNKKNIKLIFFAFIVGIIAGLAGTVFRASLFYIEKLKDYIYHTYSNNEITGWLIAFVFTTIGIAVSIILVRKYAPEASGSGIQEIEGALDNVRPMRWKRILPVKFFASLFSLGGGMLLGREGPTIQIGANIGKMVRDVFKQHEDHTNPLVSSGAAAGLACAFNAPFSGIVFVIEEMHSHFKYSFFSLAAIMVASGTADFIVRLLIGTDPIIQMTVFPVPELSGIWLFVLLGLLFSLLGLSFNKLLVLSLDIFKKISSKSIIYTIAIVSVLLTSIGLFWPSMIGGGYSTIFQALNNSFSLSFLFLLVIGRFILTIISYGSGAPGGIFAPMLVIGVTFGLIFGVVMHNLLPDIVHHPGIFAVAGMAGIFASTVRAPLTGLVLAVEMTFNFELILPLIITTVTASVITTQLGNKPIYTVLLHRTLKEENDQEK